MEVEPKADAKPPLKQNWRKWATLAIGVFCLGYAINDGSEKEIQNFLFYFLTLSWAIIAVISGYILWRATIHPILKVGISILLFLPFDWIFSLTSPHDALLTTHDGKPLNYVVLRGKDLQGIPGFFIFPEIKDRTGTRIDEDGRVVSWMESVARDDYPGALEVEWDEIVAYYFKTTSREEAIERFRRGDRGVKRRHSQMYENAENLWDAARGDLVRKADAFLQSDADVNAADKNGWTPLMCAAMTSLNPRMLSLLLRAGANPHAVSSEGKTALDYAKKRSLNYERSPGYHQLVEATLGSKAVPRKRKGVPFGIENNGRNSTYWTMIEEPEYEYLDKKPE